MTKEYAIEMIKAIKNGLHETGKDFPYRDEIIPIAKEALEMAITALEREPCEYKEYEKDLNELKKQILEEGNVLVSKQDLLERFIKIDHDYSHRPWNLLQILANINILIGEEPCSDAISREAAIKAICRHCTPEKPERCPTAEICHSYQELKALPPVQSKLDW